MAKVGFWLKGARGRLGNVSLFKGATGSTEMRDIKNKEDYKNPKTEKQMAQRMIFATASQAYSKMKAICDHSFENVKYGTETQAQFMKEALQMLRSRAAEDNGNFLIPNLKTVLSNPYVISRGSLLPPANIKCEESDGTIIMSIAGQSGSGADSYISVKNFCDALGIEKGDQITLCAIVNRGAPITPYEGLSYPTNEFVYARITVKADAADDDPVIFGGSGDWQPSVVVEGFDNGRKYFYAEEVIVGESISIAIAQQEGILAFGAIRSKLQDGKWLRSTTVMNVTDNQFIFSFSEVLPAWLAHSVVSLGIGGDRYLNNAQAQLVVEGSYALGSANVLTVNAAGEASRVTGAILTYTGADGSVSSKYIVNDNNEVYKLLVNGHVQLVTGQFCATLNKVTLAAAERYLGRIIVVDQN